MADKRLAKYGVEYVLNFELYEVDGVDLRVDAADGGTDCTIRKDQGADATATNDFVDEGLSYSLTITATEMQAKEVTVHIIDSATKVYLDKVIVIDTYGNASALHAMDFDDAVRGGLTALPNAAADAAGGLVISDAGAQDFDAMNTAAVRLTAARAQVLDDWINGGRLDLLLDAIKVVTDGQTATGTGLTAIPWNAAWDAEVESEVNDALVVFFTSAAQLVDDVWDEVLTGGTHNVATSAGRRLRGIQDFQGYENGAVWLDTINGTAGTTNYESGTVENPVDNIADALTIMASLGLVHIEVATGSSITFAASMDGKTLNGRNWTLALGGQSCSDTVVIGATVSGICTGANKPRFERCTMNAVTLPPSIMLTCGLANTITVGSAGDFFLIDSLSLIAGTSTPTFDFGATIGNTNLNMRNYSGGIQLESMGNTGTDTASIEGNGQIVEGTCTSGTVAIRGNFTVSGITNLTLSDDARFARAQLVDDISDEPFTGGTHNVADSFARRLRNLQEFGSYEGGAVFIDTVGGAAGTTSYESGTNLNPVDGIADANTLATALNLTRLAIAPASSITFVASQDNQIFKGDGWTLALGGQSISATHIYGAAVSGVCSGANKPHLTDCAVGNVTVPPTEFSICDLEGIITLPVGTVDMHHCAGESGGVLDFGAAVANTTVNLTDFSGVLTVENLGQSGTDILNIRGHGKLIFAASCIGGTVNWDGHFTETNNGSGITFNRDDISSDVDGLVVSLAALNDISAADVKTAMEADGSDLSSIMEALVNKLVITEASGNTEMFNDSDVSQGTVTAAFTSDSTYTTRKRMVI